MNKHNHFHGVLNELDPQGHALREMIPDVYRGFGLMCSAAMMSGALEYKFLGPHCGVAVGRATF
jgi:hypothetical protein